MLTRGRGRPTPHRAHCCSAQNTIREGNGRSDGRRESRESRHVCLGSCRNNRFSVDPVSEAPSPPLVKTESDVGAAASIPLPPEATITARMQRRRGNFGLAGGDGAASRGQWGPPGRPIPPSTSTWPRLSTVARESKGLRLNTRRSVKILSREKRGPAPRLESPQSGICTTTRESEPGARSRLAL